MSDEGNGEPLVVGGFLKSGTEMVTAYIQPYGKKIYAHLRIMVPSAAEDGEWVHTRKGVSLPIAQIHELKEAVDRLAEVASPNRTVAAIPAGKDEIRVGTSTFGGNQYVYVRRFYRSDEGDWRPTQKGVSVRSERLDDLIEFVARLADQAGSLSQ